MTKKQVFAWLGASAGVAIYEGNVQDLEKAIVSAIAKEEGVFGVAHAQTGNALTGDSGSNSSDSGGHSHKDNPSQAQPHGLVDEILQSFLHGD